MIDILSLKFADIFKMQVKGLIYHLLQFLNLWVILLLLLRIMDWKVNH